MNHSELLKKYDVPVPRYTSYPTVPYWSESPSTEEWLDSVRRSLSSDQATWALYVHVPFCESLCTFCGCNTMITRSHDREAPYVSALLKEYEMYLKQLQNMNGKPLRQLHLGGGSPTFLGVSELKRLVGGILDRVEVDHENFEASVEVDPRRTKAEQLQALYDLGFRRVSMGVQDFDPEVQRLVNRIQPFEVTAKLTEEARQIGYQSVNFDLIYGLPKQTVSSFEKSIDLTIQLRPDRIALYSFALVPWIKPAQRLFKDSDLPQGAEKLALYEMAYNRLTKAGYQEIGMDHFALMDDSLSHSMRDGKLHRNFMGYADLRTDVLLGIGVSSISETADCFHQNEKVLPVYERTIGEGVIPTFRGHKLDAQDQLHREQILKFMTLGRVELSDSQQADDVARFLKSMIDDGLVSLQGTTLKLEEAGRPFLRNACVALDQRLRAKQPATKVFSQAL